MRSVKQTTFFLPDTADALLSETQRGTVKDMRVAGATFRLTAFEKVERREHESDVEYAQRGWAFLLPVAGTAGVVFRRRYGWTAPEIAILQAVLIVCRDELRDLAKGPTISRETLLRDADRLEQLCEEWEAVLP